MNAQTRLQMLATGFMASAVSLAVTTGNSFLAQSASFYSPLIRPAEEQRTVPNGTVPRLDAVRDVQNEQKPVLQNDTQERKQEIRNDSQNRKQEIKHDFQEKKLELRNDAKQKREAINDQWKEKKETIIQKWEEKKDQKKEQWGEQKDAIKEKWEEKKATTTPGAVSESNPQPSPAPVTESNPQPSPAPVSESNPQPSPAPAVSPTVTSSAEVQGMDDTQVIREEIATLTKKLENVKKNIATAQKQMKKVKSVRAQEIFKNRIGKLEAQQWKLSQDIVDLQTDLDALNADQGTDTVTE